MTLAFLEVTLNLQKKKKKSNTLLFSYFFKSYKTTEYYSYPRLATSLISYSVL